MNKVSKQIFAALPNNSWAYLPYSKFMGPPAKSHSNSNSYAIMARHMENLWVRSCLHILLPMPIPIYEFFENIAFSNQLNFNLHNFLYVKVMCTKFDYFPLNWAEDITSGLKVDKAETQAAPHPRPDKGRWPGYRIHRIHRTWDRVHVNMPTPKWVCHGVDKHYCRIYLYFSLCVVCVWGSKGRQSTHPYIVTSK